MNLHSREQMFIIGLFVEFLFQFQLCVGLLEARSSFDREVQGSNTATNLFQRACMSFSNLRKEKRLSQEFALAVQSRKHRKGETTKSVCSVNCFFGQTSQGQNNETEIASEALCIFLFCFFPPLWSDKKALRTFPSFSEYQDLFLWPDFTSKQSFCPFHNHQRKKQLRVEVVCPPTHFCLKNLDKEGERPQKFEEKVLLQKILFCILRPFKQLTRVWVVSYLTRVVLLCGDFLETNQHD